MLIGARTAAWQGGIPSAYEEVNYLQSSGTQYIDTGITFEITKDMEVRAIAATIDSNRHVVVGNYVDTSHCAFSVEWGGTSNNHQRQPRLYVQDVDVQNFSHYYCASETAGVNVEMVATYTASTITATFTADGAGPVDIVNQLTSKTGSPASTMWMFLDARSNKTNIEYPGRIAVCEIIKASTLVRDFRPVVRRADGKPGMFDLVSRQFFTNQGTGEFTYG